MGNDKISLIDGEVGGAGCAVAVREKTDINTAIITGAKTAARKSLTQTTSGGLGPAVRRQLDIKGDFDFNIPTSTSCPVSCAH